MRIDDDGALEKSADITNFIFDKFSITTETTCGYSSWTNRKNERNNRIKHNMVRAGLIESNQHENQLGCAEETPDEVYRFKIHSKWDNTSPHFAWYGKSPSTNELIKFGCDIYSIKKLAKKWYEYTQEGSFRCYTSSIETMN